MHFEFTHLAIMYGEKCKNKSNDINWQKLSHIEQNYRLNKCIGILLNSIIDKLIKEKVYDNSYIIFKGDHGKPNGYYLQDRKSLLDLKIAFTGVMVGIKLCNVKRAVKKQEKLGLSPIIL